MGSHCSIDTPVWTTTRVDQIVLSQHYIKNPVFPRYASCCYYGLSLKYGRLTSKRKFFKSINTFHFAFKQNAFLEHYKPSRTKGIPRRSEQTLSMKNCVIVHLKSNFFKRSIHGLFLWSDTVKCLMEMPMHGFEPSSLISEQPLPNWRWSLDR